MRVRQKKRIGKAGSREIKRGKGGHNKKASPKPATSSSSAPFWVPGQSEALPGLKKCRSYFFFAFLAFFAFFAFFAFLAIASSFELMD
jgi:hypothetical protein